MTKQGIIPPPPTRGRVGVGEVSDDCQTTKRGFPLPYLPQSWGRGLQSAVF
jgi:hypothetical protein